MSEEIPETPVDYDNQSDPDCPTTPCGVFQNCISFLREPRLHTLTVCGKEYKFDSQIDSALFVFSSNIAEQLEARLEELGWEIVRKRPWKQ